VATSTLSGFLSGCHSRKRARHSFIRASFGSTDFNFKSLSKASAFAFSISGDPLPAEICALGADSELGPLDAFADAPVGPLATVELLLRELLLLELLLVVEWLRERFFFEFFFCFFFLVRLLLVELPLLVEWLFDRRFFDCFLAFLDRLRERLICPFLSISRIARDPACGDKVRRGGPTLTVVSPSLRGRGAWHLKQLKRLTKLRSPQTQYQSRLLSSSSLPPLQPFPHLLPLPLLLLELSLRKVVGSPTARRFLAWSFPSGNLWISKVTVSPARSDVRGWISKRCGCMLSLEKYMS